VSQADFICNMTKEREARVGTKDQSVEDAFWGPGNNEESGERQVNYKDKL